MRDLQVPSKHAECQSNHICGLCDGSIRGKTVLMVATVPSMIKAFNMDNIGILEEMGCIVEVATNFETQTVWPKDKSNLFRRQLETGGIRCHQIGFTREPTAIRQHIKAYYSLLDLLNSKKYDFIHTHTPIASALVRIAAKRKRIEVIYTAHGFHFFNGAPLKNWVLYYPVERHLSRWTKMLITINQEDYNRAKKQFRAKEIRYIPSVGFDYHYFSEPVSNANVNRRELKIDEGAFVLLSVGELAPHKNHRIVIEALKELQRDGSASDIIYLIVGSGPEKKTLEALISQYDLAKTVRLLGQVEDVRPLLSLADCFVHPSTREGFGIAPVEAMASGLALIASNVHGMKDYAKEGITGCCVSPKSATQMSKAIIAMKNDEQFRFECGQRNREIAKTYDAANVNKMMREIYGELLIDRAPFNQAYSAKLLR